MASDWKTTTFEESSIEILDGDRGKSYPKKSEFTESGYCLFLNTGNVTKDGFKFSSTEFVSSERDQLLRKGKLQREDVVLTTRGTVGNVAYYDSSIPFDHIRINSGMVILRSDDTKILPRYLYLFLRSKLFEDQVIALQSGSAQPQLPIRDIKRVEIKVPSVTEQKTIAHILGTLDDKIELNRQMNETLEAMAQALFKSWFVDFDPVIDNALAVGKPIPEPLQARAEQRQAIDKKDNAEIQNLFPDEFEFSEELGWIPKGWGVGTVGTEYKTVGGATPSTKNPDFWEGGSISWTTPKDLSGKQSKILLNTDRKITELGLNKISSGLLPVDTVLMSSRAPVGYLALAKVPVAINQGYIAFKCEKTLTPEFAIQWANTAMHDIKQRAGGTTFAEISKTNFRGIPILVPTQNTVEFYSYHVKNIYSQITSRLENIDTLAKLRDTLLPQLMSGELRVADLEKLVDEA
ncbi:MAG: restriction endonuclease subunit S [Moraxellaceae bacterium]